MLFRENTAASVRPASMPTSPQSRSSHMPARGAYCRPQLVSDIVRCCSLERAPAAVDAALCCLASMSQSAGLQARTLPPFSVSCFPVGYALLRYPTYMLHCCISGSSRRLLCLVGSHPGGLFRAGHAAAVRSVGPRCAAAAALRPHPRGRAAERRAAGCAAHRTGAGRHTPPRAAGDTA